MTQEFMTKLTMTWKGICAQYTVAEHQATFEFIEQHVDLLVVAFYNLMILEPESAEFFSDDLIQKRLNKTLRYWLLETFQVALNQQFKEAIEKQKKVGGVHARVGIPSWLIIRGVREIQRCFFALLEKHHMAEAHRMSGYVVQIMSFSTEIMCRTYEEDIVESQEKKHNYRVFSAMQDVAVQKDRQRSALLNWENDLIFKVFSGQLSGYYPPLSKSEFGLWFIHKAAYAFTGSEQAREIIKRIYEIDQFIILFFEKQESSFESIQKIRALNREIQYLLDLLFQVTEYIEAGNDSLTQLLSRRYLNTILSREINFSRKQSTPLSLIAADADYFKKINDRYGHAAGDQALKLIANTLQKYCRSSDYAFRVGGEEFLLLLIDTSVTQAQLVAERIRKEIENLCVETEQGVKFSLTLSLGCVEYDGHPDYQHFLDAADIVLYRAKHDGRNQVAV